MGNQHHFSIFTAAPTTAALAVEFDKIDGTFVFVGPSRVLNLPEFRIDEHEAPGSQKRMHSQVVQSHVSVQIPRRLGEKDGFHIAPALDHSREKFCTSRIECRIKANR